MKARVGWLDYWRILATVYVVAFHTVAAFNHTYTVPALVQQILGKGYLGTSFFMLLSGFIITLIYQHKVTDAAASRKFWQARFARIYPSYFILLLLSLVTTYLIGDKQPFTSSSLGDLLANLTLTMSFFPDQVLVYITPAWTLSTLVLFYLVFPWLIRQWRALSSRQLLTLAGSLWLVYLTVPAAYLLLVPGEHPVAFHDTQPVFSYLHMFPLLRIAEPLLGMLTALYLTRSAGLQQARYQQAYLGLLSVLGASLLIPNTFIYPLMHNGLYLPFLLLLLVTRYRMAQVQHDRPATQTVTAMADATLGVYLCHTMVINLAAKAIPHGVPVELAILITTLSATMAGMLLHHWLFKPLGDRVAHWLSTRQGAALPLPSSHLATSEN